MGRRFRPHHVLGATLVLAVGLLAGSAQSAITGKIVGRVLDTAGEPLPGATVHIEGRQLGATTDPDGRYFILQVPPGSFVVEAGLVGYRSVRQQDVVVNLDRTTEVNFELSESAIEVEPVIVVAQRPIVQQDVTSTQLSITTKAAQEIPVNTLLDAIGFQAGIDIQNRTTISVRGSTPDQVSFQVDGFEQTNPLENRSYTSMNQALVQEVQVLTGAFTAEYFSRAAVINVVTRDAGQVPTLNADVRYTPARKQHFGPDAYGDDQFDRLALLSLTDTDSRGTLFAVLDSSGNHTTKAWKSGFSVTTMINSNYPVYFPRTDLTNTSPDSDKISTQAAFTGWDAITTYLNSAGGIANYKNDAVVQKYGGNFTKESLIEYWQWQTRPYAYHDRGDYYVDAALTTPTYVLPRTGLVIGFKDVYAMLGVPAIQQAYTDRKFDLGLKSAIIPNVKFEVRANYEVIHTTIDGFNFVGGNVGSHDAQLFNSTDEGSNSGGALYNTVLSRYRNSSEGAGANKYNLSGNVPYQETISGLGGRITHTLSPSTYYALSYEYFAGEVDAKAARARDTTLTHALTAKDKNGGTIYVNEAPRGYVPGEGVGGFGIGYMDVAYAYEMTGGAYVSDFDQYSFNRVRLDVFSQVNRQHGVKLGSEVVLNNLTKDYRRFTRDMGRVGAWAQYDASPWQLGFYAQDKMEYEGLIANVGFRIDGYNAGADVYFPDMLAPYYFRREDWPTYLTSLGITPFGSGMFTQNVVYGTVPMDQDSGWIVTQQVLAKLPKEASKSFWKVSPRLGISHPVGTSTKFFFNFGWMHSLPKTGYRYGLTPESFQIGSQGSEVRGMSNPNLPMPRSVVYEVGFEQSIQNTYVARVKGYAKDDDDMPGAYTGTAWSPVTKSPWSTSLVTNTGFATYRGLELTADKVSGRFVTGSVQFDYRVQSSGNKGFQTVYDTTTSADVPTNGNKGKLNIPFRVTTGQTTIEPSLNANIVFHTPGEWGLAAGDWSLAIKQTWSRGGKYNFDPFATGNPTILRAVSNYRTNMRLTKDVALGGSRSVSFYMDVRNVFNQKTLNVGAIKSTNDYFKLLTEFNQNTGMFEQKYKVGDSQFNDVVERRFAQENDWLLYLYPREFQFGMRVSL